MNSPLNPINVCCDVVVTCDNAGFTLPSDSESATVALATDIATFQPLGVPQQIRTFGHSVLGAGPGLYKQVDAATVGMPAIFRKTDFNGNLYEAIVRNTLDAELAGVVNDGTTDCGLAITEALNWLGSKGGGRLLLPSGSVKCTTAPEILANGIVLEGASPGDPSGAGGTYLYLARVEDGTKLFIGNTSAGAQTQMVTVRNLRLHCAGGEGYAVQTRNARDVRFDDLTVQTYDCGGFLAIGTAAEATYIVTITDSFFQLGGAAGNADVSHGILMLNCAGALQMDNAFLECSAHQPNTAGILVPSWALERPDGLQITLCGFGKFGRGLEVKGGGANWTITNTIFDDIGEVGMFIEPNNNFNNIKVLGCHFFGRYAGVPGSYGILIGTEAGGSISGFQFADNNVALWNLAGLGLNGAAATDILIQGNVLNNCTMAADNTYDALTITASGVTAYSINNNIITGGPNRPRYGINNQSTSVAPHNVTGNVIVNTGTAAVNDPNRTSPNLKKVYGNTGNVAAGTTSAFGPWYSADIPATVTDAPMVRIAGYEAVVIAPRRGYIIGISGRSNTPITGGTVTMFIAVNTNVESGTLAIQLSSAFQEATNVNEDGIPFVAGDWLSIRFHSVGLAPADAVDIGADMFVYWD